MPEAHCLRGHVLIIEDIVDTGSTIRYLKMMVQNSQSDTIVKVGSRMSSVHAAALLHKPTGGSTADELDFVGFTVQDCFVCGYGLDLNERRRSIPFVFDPGHGDAGRFK